MKERLIRFKYIRNRIKVKIEHETDAQLWRIIIAQNQGHLTRNETIVIHQQSERTNIHRQNEL